MVKKGCIPQDWQSSVVLPIYKGKGDPMECGSYTGIKLLEHAMKVVKRIFEHRIWQQTEIDDMQFGFAKGKGTTDAILCQERGPSAPESSTLTTRLPSHLSKYMFGIKV